MPHPSTDLKKKKFSLFWWCCKFSIICIAFDATVVVFDFNSLAIKIRDTKTTSYLYLCQWPYNLTLVCVSNTNLASCSPDLLHIGRFVAENPRSPPKHVMTMVNKVVQIKQQNMNVFPWHIDTFSSWMPLSTSFVFPLQHFCKIKSVIWCGDAAVVLFSHQP